MENRSRSSSLGSIFWTKDLVLEPLSKRYDPAKICLGHWHARPTATNGRGPTGIEKQWPLVARGRRTDDQQKRTNSPHRFWLGHSSLLQNMGWTSVVVPRSLGTDICWFWMYRDKKKAHMWFGEIRSCSSLTLLLGPAWVLLKYVLKTFFRVLYFPRHLSVSQSTPV